MCDHPRVNGKKVLLRHLIAALAIFLILAPADAFGQDMEPPQVEPAPERMQEPEPLKVDLDHATFAFDGSDSMVELYLAVDAASLGFEQHENLLKATLPINVAIRRGSDVTLDDTPTEPVWADSVALDFVLSDTSGITEGQYFLHQIRSTVPPGEYRVEVIVPADEMERRPSLALERDLVVPDYSDSDLVVLSDLTLASDIRPSDDRESAFYKNGLAIRPNANQLFGNHLRQIFYYVEAYNLPSVVDDAYTALIYISEANTAAATAGLQKRTQRDSKTPDVLVGQFDISTLPSGSYFLKVVLLNSDNEALVEQSRKFFVFNPDVQRELPAIAEVTFETSEFASMSEEEVDKAYKRIDVIATQQEKRRIRSIEDLDARKRYLMDFWQKRDPNPRTRNNEAREDFYKRVQYANERYTSGFSEGWETDRGRAVVRYGIPGNVEPHLYERDTIPYEIWEFTNIPGEGQAMFVFADRSGFGDFELIHSTVSGERSLPDWQNELRR